MLLWENRAKGIQNPWITHFFKALLMLSEVYPHEVFGLAIDDLGKGHSHIIFCELVVSDTFDEGDWLVEFVNDNTLVF